MKPCADHWKMMRDAIEEAGMSSLVAINGEEAAKNMATELEGGEAPFDPLMSMHWHWMISAMRIGGLYLLGQTEDGSNDGQFCPVCEFAKNWPGFDAKEDIETVAKQMQAHCRERGLIPRVS